MDKIKIILDTDIGTDIDDALALAYLLMKPECELMGITTVTGEAKTRAKLASVICKAANRGDIPIYPGNEECILIEQKEKFAPQSAVLESWQHEEKFPEDQALSFMQRTIRENPGEIVLVGISPMGNIARLFLLDSEIPSLLKGLYLMCGKFSEYDFKNWYREDDAGDGDFSAFEPHNINKFMAGGSLEMNALIDPYATAVVYQNTGNIHRSVGVDMTHRVTLPMDEFQKRSAEHPLFRPILDMAGVWFRTKDEVCFHDPLAVVSIFNDSVCKFVRGNVSVELGSKSLMGYTLFEENLNGKHEIACSVNTEAFFDEYFSVFQ